MFEVTGSVSMSAAHRFRYTLAAGATAVVIGAGFTVVGFERQSSDNAAERTSTDLPLVTQPPVDLDADPELLLDASGAPSLPPSATPSQSPSASPSASSKSPTPKASPSRKSTPKASPTPTKRKTTAPPAQTDGGSVPSTSGSVLDQVLAHINAARQDEGLSPYSLDDNLSKAAAVHNDLMIEGCGLSHQCNGEDGIGPRFSAQGVQWSSAGENIGFGNAGNNTAQIVKAANGLTDSMLAEVPPEDGHRKNLLSKGFKRIGLSIVRDGDGRVWMTQDFVG